MTYVYFIRHAQSDKSFHGESERPLTKDGFYDCEKVSEALKDKGISHIISSPYTRAVQTVEPLAKTLALPIEIDGDLRERSAGKWHGDRFFDFVQKQWEDFDYRIEGGESLRQVQNRNIEALNRLLYKYEGETLALATHGTALSTIINYFFPKYGYNDFLKIADLMPIIFKMTFERYKKASGNENGIICTDIKNIFSVHKSY